MWSRSSRGACSKPSLVLHIPEYVIGQQVCLWQPFSAFTGKTCYSCSSPAFACRDVTRLDLSLLFGLNSPSVSAWKLPRYSRGEGVILKSSGITGAVPRYQPVHRHSPLPGDSGAHSSLVSHAARPVTVLKTSAIGRRENHVHKLSSIFSLIPCCGLVGRIPN